MYIIYAYIYTCAELASYIFRPLTLWVGRPRDKDEHEKQRELDNDIQVFSSPKIIH